MKMLEIIFKIDKSENVCQQQGSNPTSMSLSMTFNEKTKQNLQFKGHRCFLRNELMTRKMSRTKRNSNESKIQQDVSADRSIS